MRHLKSFNKLSRTHSHRKALYKNMSIALFRHGRIKTTKTKAKEIRRIAEKLITRADDLRGITYRNGQDELATITIPSILDKLVRSGQTGGLASNGLAGISLSCGKKHWSNSPREGDGPSA